MSTPRGHSRHLTWPLTIDLLPNHFNLAPTSSPARKYKQHLPDITENEDPFSHFLSPVLDDEGDPFDETSYSAGITPYSAEPRARRDDLFRARLEEKWEGYMARRLLQHGRGGATRRSLPAPLPPPFPQHDIPMEESEEDLIPDLMDEAMDDDASSGPSTPEHLTWVFPSADHVERMDGQADGWDADRGRTTMGRELQRPNRPHLRSSRTLSGKRHSWREPSEELYTLKEEHEEDRDAMERGRSGGNSKKRKMVHWDEEVQVLEYRR